MVGELFPAEARGAASGLTTVVNWGGSTIVTQSFALVLTALGPLKVRVLSYSVLKLYWKHTDQLSGCVTVFVELCH